MMGICPSGLPSFVKLIMLSLRFVCLLKYSKYTTTATSDDRVVGCFVAV